MDLWRPSLGTWTTLATYTGANAGPGHVTLNLTPYLEAGLKVRFRYTDNTEWDWYLQVDNVKVSDASAVTLSWTDLNQGETGYQVWASNSTSSGSPFGSALGADTTTAVVGGYTCFRVQPKGSGYVCGDGLVGGSW